MDEDLTRKVNDLLVLTNLHSNQIVQVVSHVRELSQNHTTAYQTQMNGFKQIHKNMMILNQKIQALAAALVKNTDIHPSEIDFELRNVQETAQEVSQEIENLINRSKTENPPGDGESE